MCRKKSCCFATRRRRRRRRRRKSRPSTGMARRGRRHTRGLSRLRRLAVHDSIRLLLPCLHWTHFVVSHCVVSHVACRMSRVDIASPPTILRKEPIRNHQIPAAIRQISSVHQIYPGSEFNLSSQSPSPSLHLSLRLDPSIHPSSTHSKSPQPYCSMPYISLPYSSPPSRACCHSPSSSSSWSEN
jgi:hypothetical protein